MLIGKDIEVPTLHSVIYVSICPFPLDSEPLSPTVQTLVIAQTHCVPARTSQEDGVVVKQVGFPSVID